MYRLKKVFIIIIVVYHPVPLVNINIKMYFNLKTHWLIVNLYKGKGKTTIRSVQCLIVYTKAYAFKLYMLYRCPLTTDFQFWSKYIIFYIC